MLETDALAATKDSKQYPGKILEAYSGLNYRTIAFLEEKRLFTTKIRVSEGKIILREHVIDGLVLKEGIHYRIRMVNGSEILLLALKVKSTGQWLEPTQWTEAEVISIDPPRDAGGIVSYLPDPYPHME